MNLALVQEARYQGLSRRGSDAVDSDSASQNPAKGRLRCSCVYSKICIRQWVSDTIVGPGCCKHLFFSRHAK